MAVLHIRETQLRALKEISKLHSVEGGLQRLFPEECQALGAAGLQLLAEDSIDAARRLGFDPEHYLGFASMQMVFGPEFWEKEGYEWAKKILEDKFLWTPRHRMQELRQASIFFLASVAEKEPIIVEGEDVDDETLKSIADEEPGQ